MVWIVAAQVVFASLVPAGFLLGLYWLISRAQGDRAVEGFRGGAVCASPRFWAPAVCWGGVIGFLLGLSVSPVAEPLATGIFGLIGGLALYIFGKDHSAGWMVGAAALSFAMALLVNLLAANLSSIPTREYDFCIEAFANPKADEKLLCRLRSHCEERLPEYYEGKPRRFMRLVSLEPAGAAMTTITRFAPSPTGRLHVGNLRPALLNWLYARKAGGSFILRIDDTDLERSKEEHVEAIKRDLDWLGLGWDRFERQSARMERYNAAADELRASGRLYPAYETATELNLKRKYLAQAGRPPVYDRAALRAFGCGARQTGGGGPRAALGASNWIGPAPPGKTGSGAETSVDCGLRVRSGADPRGWRLSLHVVQRLRRHRLRRHRRDPGRGSRHQHRHADSDFRRPRRPTHRLRPSLAPRGCGWRRAFQAARLPDAWVPARGRSGADGAAVADGAAGHVRSGGAAPDPCGTDRGVLT